MDTRAAAYGRDAALADFKATFRQLAPYKHRYEVFRDFVTMAACSLHNAVHMDDAREQEYMTIIGQYKPDDQNAFSKLLASLVTALDEEPRDVLGPLYMELEIASKDQGQFFTPPELSEMMARMTFAPELDRLEHQPFITAGEPACGAGGMILALVKVMTEAGYDPSRKLWVQAIDVERLAALMCYIQLSLWHVPAEVIVGNTLSWDIREVWYTPAHHLGLWKYRLARDRETGSVSAKAESPAETPATTPVKPTQLGFDF
jgi:type I restriction-modification system DNA methylase subunit